ncbi:MAG TPA: carboxymuconolactone decarboxylase family protein [Rhodocyclaceae bacterium]
MLDEKTKELIAVGATITANCQSCLEYHADKAAECGATPAEIQAAVAVGREVRIGSGTKMDGFAAKCTGASVAASGCGCAA